MAFLEGIELSLLDIPLPKPRPQHDHPGDRVSSSFQLSDRDFSTLSFVILSVCLGKYPSLGPLTNHGLVPSTSKLLFVCFVYLVTRPRSVWSMGHKTHVVLQREHR